MRLAHVCVAGTQPLLSRDGGAIQRRIIELSKAQVAMGHEVVAYSAGQRDHAVRHHGVDVREDRCTCPCRGDTPSILLAFGAIMNRSPKPTVVNFHGQPEGSVLGWALHRPSVLFYDYFMYRGLDLPVVGQGYRAMLRSFDLLLPCSEFCRERSVRHWGVDERQVCVQYNGVDLTQFRVDRVAGEAERKHLGLQGPIVLYVGRVNQQKGTDLLLECWPQVKQQVPRANLVIAGPISQFGSGSSTPDAARWRRRIAQAGGVYLGPVDEGRLAGTYQMADVFVMPTRQNEMFGMAAVEAQACGVPTIASDHGGLRETVPPECGGRFRPGDAGELSTQIMSLLMDDARRASCGEAAAANAARFSWARVARALDRSYQKAGIDG